MKYNKQIVGIIISVGIIIVVGYLVFGIVVKKDMNQLQTNTVKDESEDYYTKGTLSAWTTYWDMNDLQAEMNIAAGTVDQVILFAAYFRGDDRLFLPDNVKEFGEINQERYPEIEYYISIVNDRLLEDGGSVLKEKALLERLYRNEATINQHIQDILALTKSLNISGIEIDYEGFRDDVTLWQKHLNFCTRLAKAADKQGLSVRVVLEPGIKFDILEFPQELEYVVMAYNLYGTHSEPGPKANISFINELIEKMRDLPERKGIALATGGFNWKNQQDAVGVTQAEAERLASKYNVNIKRDDESYVNYFKYYDDMEQKHEVWFADQETLRMWIEIANKNGIQDISIWRMEKK